MINWNDVIKYANQGVPAPDKRVEKTEVEWKAELSEEDFYLNKQGFRVFTEKYHIKRGYCCKSGCKHCPYGYDKNTDTFK